MESLASRPTAGGVEGGGATTTSPPGKPSEETNGVALVTQQELDFNSKVKLLNLHTLNLIMHSMALLSKSIIYNVEF